MRRTTSSTNTRETPKPMDPGAAETKTQAAFSNNQRVCYAIKTLVAEVTELFPEVTGIEYSDYDGRNTALTVSFDLTAIPEDERPVVSSLLTLVGGDLRVSEATVEEDVAMVTFASNALTQDSREPFRLSETWAVLAEENDTLGGSL